LKVFQPTKILIKIVHPNRTENKKTKKQRAERNKEKYFESTLEDMKQQKITEKQQ